MDVPRENEAPETTVRKTRFVITYTESIGPVVEGECIGPYILRFDAVPDDPSIPNFIPTHLPVILESLRACTEQMLRDGIPGGLFLRPYQEGLLPGPGLYCLHLQQVEGAEPLPPFTGDGERDLLLALLARFAKPRMDGSWEVSLGRLLDGADGRRMVGPLPAGPAGQVTFRLTPADWQRGLLTLQRWQAASTAGSANMAHQETTPLSEEGTP